MKTRNIALTVAALVIIVAGCKTVVVNQDRDPTDPAARYVIIFEKVEVKKTDAFKTALNTIKYQHWTRDLKLHQKGLPDETIPPYPGGAKPNPIAYTLSIQQEGKEGSNPDSLHVTQRVGLNNLDDVKLVLDEVKTK